MLKGFVSAVSRKSISLFLSAILVLSLATWTGLNLLHARNTAASNACINNLRNIDAAKQAWAQETRAATNAIPSWPDVLPNLGEKPKCPRGGIYTLGTLAELPACSIGGPEHSLEPGASTEPWHNRISLGVAAISGIGLLLVWLLRSRRGV